MRSRVEEAAEQMRELVNSNPTQRLQNSNEAETRLLLVDRILAILGWAPEEYKPEQPTSTGGYTDYLLTLDGQPRLIVEAKKKGYLQPLSVNIQNPQYTNSYLYKSCGDEVRVLLDQCRRYCSDCGLPYAVATTGTIWIVLVGLNISGVEWGRMRSFVFHSLQDIADRFNQFYDLISRDAIKNNSLEERFGSMILVQPRFAIKPRQKVTDTAPIGELPIRRDVGFFFDSFWSDITRDDRTDMLEHCYVDTREVTEFSKELRVLLEYDAVLDEQGVTIEEADQQALEQEISDQMDSGNPKTILLVGRIGSGKSTFVHKFVREQSRPKNNICTVVNLINRATIRITEDRVEEEKLAALILEKLSDEFEGKFNPYDPSVLRACFRKEIDLLRMQRQEFSRRKPEEYVLLEEEHVFKLSNEDKYRHLVGYIRYVRSKRYKIWIVLDNIDQGTDSYQAFVYAFAHKLTDDSGCVTMITLREDTYLAARETGFLNVRGSDIVFRLNAPELRQVIAKRRQYVEYLLKHDLIKKPLRSSRTLVRLLNWHIKILFLGSDDRLRVMVTALSLHNVRLALAMIRNYYTSYHSTFTDIYTAYGESEDGPTDENVVLVSEFSNFLKSLMLGNTWHYDQSESEIFNLFDVDSHEQSSHFLALRILAYLSRFSPKSTISLDKLSSDLVFLGHQRHRVENQVRRLLASSLIVSPTLPQASSRPQAEALSLQLPKTMRLVISARGYYYLNTIAGHEYYQTRVGEDTVWYDEEKALAYAKALQESVEMQSEHGRVDWLLATSAREIFLQYLRKSMFEEAQSGRFRSQNELARIVNSIVEQRVFGGQITHSVYTQEELVPDETNRAEVVPPSSQGIIQNLQKVSAGEDEQQQLALGIENTDYKKMLQEAATSLGHLPDKRFQKSRNLVRVLWSLELAFRSGTQPLRASNIAFIINKFGGEQVFAPNIAKFFRNQKLSHEFTHLWKEEPEGYYAISQSGRDLLLSMMDSQPVEELDEHPELEI